MNQPISTDNEHMTFRLTTLTAALLFALISGGCANTSFTSTSANKKETAQKRQNGNAEKDSTDLGTGAKDGDDSGDQPDDEIGTSVDQDGPGEEEKFDDCLVKKADNYNINLIFDNSGSQRRNDPNNIRASGAIDFVEQFSRFVGRNKKSRVYISVLSFNTKSIRGGQAWVKLSGDNAESIKSEINRATANPNGGTAYSPVLKDAALYFSELKKSVSAAKAKNYVVFLTDGLPNAASSVSSIFFPQGFPGGSVETMDDITKSIDTLVNNHDVAIIAIASGDGIPAQGESITQSLAKPTTGVSDKSHKGIYKRARTTDDLKDTWKSLFGVIGDCE
jgi:hypothetical protein